MTSRQRLMELVEGARTPSVARYVGMPVRKLPMSDKPGSNPSSRNKWCCVVVMTQVCQTVESGFKRSCYSFRSGPVEGSGRPMFRSHWKSARKLRCYTGTWALWAGWAWNKKRGRRSRRKSEKARPNSHGYLVSVTGLVYDCPIRNNRVGVGKMMRGKARGFEPLVKGAQESRIKI